MSAAAFMDADAANNSSNVAAGCNADSSSKSGSWLGNLSEGHDGWPAGMMLEAGAAGGYAAGDASCSLAVCAPGTVNTASDANSHQSSIAEQHPYLQQAEAVAQTGPGPCAEGVEIDSQSLYDSTAATCRQSAPVAGYSSSQSSSASATLSSLSFKKPKHDDPWLNPGVGLELMQNMGIAGSGRQPFARAASSLLHAALLAPRALHNSPRGCWLVRCLFEAIYLVMYQAAMMGYVKPLFAGHRWWVVCFIGLVVGNTTDIIFQIHYQHHNNVWRFLSNHAAKLDVLVNVGLLGLLTASIERLALHSGHSLEHELAEEPHTLAAAGLTWLWIAASACAVLVWARALIIILPLSAQLGAMLCTLRKAAEEASVLVPVLVAVVLGFGTTLCAVYQDVVPEYSTLAGSLRMLVAITGGNMDLLEFETHAADNPFSRFGARLLRFCT
uniref:Uncharacterized protein n=1 Tax=Tetradesmus obliquus TaxID=3088 RepID=A0A383VJ41_TETOB|eukprot:jgi/Sobl393_1/4145/SZX65535.1